MRKDFITLTITTIALLFVLGGGYVYQTRDIENELGDGKNINKPVVGNKTYRSENLGFSFTYPATYFLETREEGDGHKGHFVVMLTEDTEENRLVREGKSPGREGPVSIMFDAYQSPDQIILLDWVKENSASNFIPLGKDITETTIVGKPAISYRWSGLYEADAFALVNRDYIFVGTATYIFPGDQIRKDFSDITQTLQLF